jgi:hypothetical protein
MASGDLYDFANPVMMAAIVNDDDTRIPLWTNSYEDGVVPPLPILSDLVVSLKQNGFYEINATLAGPYEYMIKFLDNEVVKFGTSYLQVQFGYLGASGKAVLSPVFAGLILTPDVSVGTEITVNILATPHPVYSMKRLMANGQIAQKTRRDIVERLIWGPDPANPRRVEINDDEVKKTPGPWQALWSKEKIEAWAPGYLSEWKLVKDLVEQAQCSFDIGYDYKSGTTKINVYPEEARRGEIPKWRFQFFPGNVVKGDGSAGLGPATGVYPILSFNTPTAAIFYPQSLVGGFLSGISDETGEPTKKQVGADKDKAGGQPVLRTGAKIVRPTGVDYPKPNFDTGNGLDSFHTDDPESKKKIDQVHGNIKGMIGRGGVRAEVETLGVPDLLVGHNAEVVGLGTKFDWVYMVYEVVHTLGANGFSTNWVGYTQSIDTAQGEEAEGNVQNPAAEGGDQSSSTEAGSAT